MNIEILFFYILVLFIYFLEQSLVLFNYLEYRMQARNFHMLNKIFVCLKIHRRFVFFDPFCFQNLIKHWGTLFTQRCLNNKNIKNGRNMSCS